VYREQEYVERCFCNAPATDPCDSCGRARCKSHLARGLCNRCTQFIGRELDQRSGDRWIASSVFGTVTTLAMMIANMPAGILIALPLSIAGFFGVRFAQRKRLIARMGPSLSASKGELPPPPREPDPTPNTGRGGLPPGVGW